MGIRHSRGTGRRGHSCYTRAGAVVNGGVRGLSVEQGIARQRHAHEQAHIGIKPRVGEEGRQGAEGAHEETTSDADLTSAGTSFRACCRRS
jgi:hypothetical protein